MSFAFKWLLVAVLSAVKMMVFGVPTAYAYGFTGMETFTATFVGSAFGSVLFVYGGNRVFAWLRHRSQTHRKAPTAGKIKKIRRFIWLRNRYGLPGLALLTPSVLSIPLGCLLAIRFYHHPNVVLKWMIPACLGWSLLVSFVGLF